MWNPFRSKLAAAVLAGVDNIHIKPGEWVGGWVGAQAGGPSCWAGRLLPMQSAAPP